jgi:hypothetical protein
MTKIIDRVIFCLNSNENYIDFWNYISKIYKNKFDVQPTLFFSGTNEEFLELITSRRLSTEYGEIINLPRIPSITYDSNLDWTCTWGLFYGASLFPDDVCMLSGIDQIPLSGMFFEEIKKIDARKNYIIGFADAYDNLKNAYGDTVYPSSHHVGLGKYFKTIYNIKEKWADELQQVTQHKKICTQHNCWGLDELYSSHMIKHYMDTNKEHNIYFLNNFLKNWANKRIDRVHGSIVLDESVLAGIKNGKYSEYHSTRPFNTNTNMNILYDTITKIKNKVD